MWRALGANLAILALLFGLHVVFASQNMDLAFAVVALSISVQVVFFGPVTVLFDGANLSGPRRATNRLGFLFGFPLSFGLAWAYGDMAWSLPWVVGIVGATLGVHVVLDRRLSVSHLMNE